MLLFIGTAEIIFIIFIVLMIFGSKKIPEVARALGKGFREFQKATDEIKREISKVETIAKEDPMSKPTQGTKNSDSSLQTDNQ